jgi:hypothetical protein
MSARIDLDHHLIADLIGHWNGRACSNHIRVRRDAIERVILGGIRRDLLAPERVERMVKEMHIAYTEQMKELAARVEALPRELQELDARIMRLRERLKAGDPDLAADELQAGIDRAEKKRRELLDARPAERENARMLAMLPRAADLYREQSIKDSAAIPQRRRKGAPYCARCWAKSCFHPEKMGHCGLSTECSLLRC